MSRTRAQAQLAPVLADAFLAPGAWREQALVERAALCLVPRPPWLRRVARRVVRAYPRPPVDRPRELAAFVAFTLELPDTRRGGPAPRVRRRLVPELAMGPTPWPVPPLDSVGELAALLALEPGRLAWLADARGLERRAPDERLRNYRYTWLPRASGLPRLIEAPSRT